MSRKFEKGYSLATLAILVASFSAATVGLMTYTEHSPKIDKTAQVHKDIQQTLEYIKVHAADKNIIPCPADPTLPPTHAGYLVSAGTYPDCSSSLPNKSTNYFKGLVPTKTLGISDKFAFDSHHAQLTYMVSKGTNYFKVNTNRSCVTKDGALVSGCSYTNASQFIQFASGKEPNVVIISHGQDQVGALKKDQASNTPFSKTAHQIQAEILPNGKYFDSIPQAINHDYYLAGNMDEIIFKPLVPLGNPSTTAAASDNIKYDDTVLYARVELTSNVEDDVQCWNRTNGNNGPNPSIKASFVALNQFDICFITLDNNVHCKSEGYNNPIPNIKARYISDSASAMCAIKINDNVQCLGWGSDGNHPTPEIQAWHVVGNVSNQNQCAIKKSLNPSLDREVQCWGNISTPSPVIKAKGIVSVSNSMCAIKLDDEVQCWGNPLYGGQAPANLKATSIAALDGGAACAIEKGTNQVKCWGSEYGGGTSPNPAIYATSIAASSYAMCAIKTDGFVQCWGDSSSGGAAPANLKAKSIFGGQGETMCAIKLDDTVQCWGNQTYGGNAPANLDAKFIIGNLYFRCAIKLNDDVQCWGDTNGPSSTIKAKSIATNINTMCAIKK